ncbi:M14 family metallopeptidase [Siminovitchia fortis]|uniref:LysM peptidoglycan-binding domain-containing protein n=1 Tax=Siminovitchia fortis TaxID=254758 RepID=A0A443IZK9_9BACI|nr:M14 family metallopeptidase [Siminovitchia fortis]RWR13597.1 LysM peptidoglycan-binding domain-containing protein [Siminovitchia fortis]WHY81946.1 M14 family metallopeptidase [Siminovitchia fortis]
MEIRVRSGDTLWHYSQLFHIPFILILDSNANLANPNALQVGQTIQIPGYLTGTYTIRPGDTFWKIAQDRSVNVDALLILNQDINPNELTAGQQINIPVRVMSRVIDGNEPYDFQKMSRDMNRLMAIYPFIKRREAGKSVLGNPLHEMQIGRKGRKVQINASFHANEWITTPIFMRFLNDYMLALTSGLTIKGIPALTMYTESRLYAIPMVNPDGVNLVLNGPPPEREAELVRLNRDSRDFSGWKANIRGVDLNKQFPAKWEFEKERKPKEPGPRDFPGYTPLSEPETKTMAGLARTEKYDRLLALHTQGQEIYWGYEGLEPPESKKLAKDFARLSGYEAVRYIDNYTGYKDWFIQDFRKPGFTIELGKGQNPLPLSQFEEIYSHMLGLFVRSLI